jgi:hypothetical protein
MAGLRKEPSNMYIGTFIPLTPKGFYTNWMPRGGDNAIFTYEKIEDSNVTLRVDVYHKDNDDPGEGTKAGEITVQIGSSDYYEKILTG